MSKIVTINELPSSKLPEFWGDNERINALYAPFRDRAVNARDWDSKLQFWKSIIDTWANYNNTCCFSEAELKKWFIKNGRVPACLSIVLPEMIKTREIQTFNDFMVCPQKTWSGWAVDIMVKKPLMWSFNKVKNTFLSPINIDTKLVHLPTVRKLSEKLFNSVPDDCRNKLLTTNETIEVTNFKDVDKDTINLLIHYLQCQDQIETFITNINSEYTEKNVLLIKFASNNSQKVQPINEIDVAKHRLETNEKMLLKKIEGLESAKAEATKNAREFVSKGMRQMAKTCLRKQHEFDKRIEMQVNVLDNVQTLLGRIGNAESDSKVLDCYKSGLAALKRVFKENSMDEDGVSDTMADMSDTMEAHDDMQSSLSQSVFSVPDSELEEELAELLNESESSKPPPTQPTSPAGGRGLPTTDKSVEDDLERRLHNLKFPPVPSESPETLPVKNISSPS